jgi:outer membrane protein, multidrug efflux system
MMGNRSLVFLVLLAVGCSPTVKRTDTLNTFTVPKQWTAGETLAGPSEKDWWSYFGDAGLDQAVGTALSDNIDLRAAVARVNQAMADARIAGADKYPAIDVGLSKGRSRQNFIGLPIPGGEGRVLSTTSSNAGLGFNFSWELDLWGRIAAGEMAAEAGVEARQADLDGARLSLTAQTAKAWFAAIEADRQVAVSRASVASFTSSAERVRARFEMGLKPALDLRLALSEVERAKALLEQRLEQRDRAVRQLEILVGGYPNGDYPLAEDLPRMPDRVPAGLPAEIINRRPDLLAAERNFFASDARLHAAKADLKPRFALTARTGTASSDLTDLVSGDRFIWNFLANVSQPLFYGGRLKANVMKNEAIAQEAAAIYESMMLTAFNEVETSLAAEDVLARREEALEEATTQAVAAQRLSEERYRLGLTDIITLLSAQRSALTFESEWITVRRLRLDNRVNLHLSLGGGFEAPQDRTGDKVEKKDGGKT